MLSAMRLIRFAESPSRKGHRRVWHGAVGGSGLRQASRCRGVWGTAGNMRISETGFVVNCDGPDELEARVSELLANRSRLIQMGHAARQWVVEQFDWKSLSAAARRVFEAYGNHSVVGNVAAHQADKSLEQVAR